MDDQHENEVSIFGLRELWQALGDVLDVCWLGQRRNGQGFPGGQMAWARLVDSSSSSLSSKMLEIEMLRLGNGTKSREDRRVSVLDLGEK